MNSYRLGDINKRTEQHIIEQIIKKQWLWHIQL
jgi:hypothetical protein